jgi:3-dehydroquinate synthetase
MLSSITLSCSDRTSGATMWIPTSEQLSLRSSRDHTFNVTLFDGLHSSDLCKWIETYAGNRTVLAVTTPTVERLYGNEIRAAFASVNLKPSWLVLNCTERTKTMKSVLTVCRAATDAEIDRRDALVAIGGGVCSDIVTQVQGRQQIRAHRPSPVQPQRRSLRCRRDVFGRAL